MAKLIFLRRTEREIQLFGGDVYFDIDGKNIGTLSRVNQEIAISSGKHTIKMYKSHSYDTFIGVAESTIHIEENENLMVRYATPVTANQPGNLIISAYDPIKEQDILRARESSIQRDYVADENRKREQNEKYNTGLIFWTIFIIVDAIIFAIWMASI
jgi:hypothetical protein